MALGATFACRLKGVVMKTKALLVIDVQNDFCPGGALAVTDGDSIVPIINDMMADYDVVLMTQDWHPAGHSSFASSHPDRSAFELIDMPYGPQVLWPDHCVQGSQGAAFHPDLNTTRADMIIRKGFTPSIDSYSAFFENDRSTPTGLEGYLRTREISEIDMVGLATDFCVCYSALDAARLGFETRVLTQACRAIDMDGSLNTALADMRNAKVEIV